MLRSVALKACRRWIFLLAALLPPIVAAAQAAEELADSASRLLPGLRGVAVDDAQAEAAGIHKLASTRLTLVHGLAHRRRGPPPAGGLRSGVSPVVRLFSPLAGRARQMADDRLRHEGQGPLPEDRPLAGRLAAVSARVLAERRTLALRAAQRVLSPPLVAARRDARLHEHAFGRLRAAVVHGRHGRAAGHPSAPRRPLDAQLDAGAPRGRAGVGTHPHHQGRLRGPSGHVPGRRGQLFLHGLSSHRAVRLVLGPGGDVGPRSALPRSFSPTLSASSRKGTSARSSGGCSAGLAGGERAVAGFHRGT